MSLPRCSRGPGRDSYGAPGPPVYSPRIEVCERYTRYVDLLRMIVSSKDEYTTTLSALDDPAQARYGGRIACRGPRRVDADSRTADGLRQVN